MKHEIPSSRSGEPFFAQDPFEDGEPGLPHSLGSCLLISLMFHIMLLVFGAGFGNESPGHGFGKAGARISAHLNEPLPSAEPAPPAFELPPAELFSPTPLSSLEDLLPLQSAAAATEQKDESGEAGGFAYYPVEMLTQRPRFLDDLQQAVAASLQGGAQGRLVVDLLVSSNGSIDSVQVESSELGEANTRIFVQRLNALKLAPGELKGSPVRARWRLEFSLQGEY